MHIDKNQDLFGYSIIKIQEVLKKIYFNQPVDNQLVSNILGCSLSEAKNVLTRLIGKGYLKLQEHKLSLTIKGQVLAGASSAKQLKRKTAINMLSAFLERVKEVNANDHYLFEVTQVDVFGSFLSEKETISDIDLIYGYRRKIEDSDEFERLRNLRVNQAKRNGRNFRGWLDEDFWPETEFRNFLKARNGYLHFSREEVKTKNKRIASQTKTIFRLENLI